MLDFADFVAINKFDRKGAADALRDVRKQYQRNRELFARAPDEMPVFGTIAARFNDDGVTALYQALAGAARAARASSWHRGSCRWPRRKHSTAQNAIVPAARVRYLAEIAETVRGYHALGEDAGEDRARAPAAHGGEGNARPRPEIARNALALRRRTRPTDEAGQQHEVDDRVAPHMSLEALAAEREKQLDPRAQKLLDMWPKTKAAYTGDEYVVKIRGKEIRTALTTRIAVRHARSARSRCRSSRTTARSCAGSSRRTCPAASRSPPACSRSSARTRTRRACSPARAMPSAPTGASTCSPTACRPSGCRRRSTRSRSTATIRTRAPTSTARSATPGVSIATLDDMKVLYSGFDLCAPNTSVSMTINGPAPTILAMFMNTAIDQQIEKFQTRQRPRADRRRSSEDHAHGPSSTVRGTVQADILKEDQGQNTCIFSTEFSLKVMGDIQQYFVQHQVQNFYSVSISGYHIAEAGANPISQLAFTLSNGFTFVEAYLARGMHIDDFAPNLSFFFSYGMDPEYAVIGRVARRIWAVAMRERYGANERSQKLKFHSQTSGRSLHAQEIAFNDIRTTLQALISTYDNTNSLHTNAYDEAITTPTEESVRRAMAIQLIINREWGLGKNENPNQGSFIIEELTDLVEEAVLKEFEAISERGGVLGAMETGYQRGKIQEESLYYEHKKHDGSLPDRRRQHLPQSARRRNPEEDRARPLDRGGEAVAAEAAARVPRAQRGGGAGSAREAEAHA